MNFINVQNLTKKHEIIPARDGFGVVLAPGERVTVYPEGKIGQSQLRTMLSRGSIVERGRIRTSILRFMESTPTAKQS